MKKYIVIFSLFFYCNLYSQSDSILVYFEKNSSYLKQEEIDKLKVNSEPYKIEIIAFCDYLGPENYNLWLSQKRANRVKHILLKNDFNSDLIQQEIGKGEIKAQNNESELGVPKNRKAIVYLWYSELPKTKEPKQDLLVESKDTVTEAIIQDIDTLSVGSSITLPSLSFIGGRHRLTPESQPSLKSLLDFLIDNPNFKIAIEGHICCETIFEDGLDQETGIYNLSTARAMAIYNYLIENGIDSNRLSYEGFGRTRPIYPLERNEMEQQANRRVEFRLTEK